MRSCLGDRAVLPATRVGAYFEAIGFPFSLPSAQFTEVYEDIFRECVRVRHYRKRQLMAFSCSYRHDSG